MLHLINKKVLITTNNWFYGKDGKSYHAAYGTLKAVHEAGKSLGFIPNRSHANWFVEIGTMVIMGCQVLYTVECDTLETGAVTDWVTDNEGIDGIRTYTRPSAIYLAD